VTIRAWVLDWYEMRTRVNLNVRNDFATQVRWLAAENLVLLDEVEETH